MRYIYEVSFALENSVVIPPELDEKVDHEKGGFTYFCHIGLGHARGVIVLKEYIEPNDLKNLLGVDTALFVESKEINPGDMLYSNNDGNTIALPVD